MTNFNYALAALGATATVYSVDSSYPPSQAIDGSDVTYARQWNQYQQWLAVDLKAEQYITHVKVLQNAAGHFAAGYVVSYSHNNVDWFDVGTFNGVLGWNDYDVGGITARYWRVWATNNMSEYWWHTLEVIGPVEAPPPVVNPAPEYINAWLDGLEANYVPTIDDWLAANP